VLSCTSLGWSNLEESHGTLLNQLPSLEDGCLSPARPTPNQGREDPSPRRPTRGPAWPQGLCGLHHQEAQQSLEDLETTKDEPMTDEQVIQCRVTGGGRSYSHLFWRIWQGYGKPWGTMVGKENSAYCRIIGNLFWEKSREHNHDR